MRMRGGDMASLNLEDMQQIQKELQAKYLEKWGGLSPKIGRDKLLWICLLYTSAAAAAVLAKLCGKRHRLRDLHSRLG